MIYWQSSAVIQDDCLKLDSEHLREILLDSCDGGIRGLVSIRCTR